MTKSYNLLTKLFSLNATRALLIVATTIYLSRITGPEVVGQFILLVAFIEIISLFNDFSLGHQIIQNTGLRNKLNSAFGVQIVLALVITTIFLVSVYVYDYSVLIVAAIMLVGKSMSVIFSIHSSIAYIEGKFLLESRINIILQLVSSITSISWCLSGNDPLIAFALFYTIPLVSSMVLAKALNITMTPQFSCTDGKFFFKNGVSLLISSGYMRVKSHFDRILIGEIWGLAQLGIISRVRTFSDVYPNLYFTSFRNLYLTSLVNDKSAANNTSTSLVWLGFISALLLLSVMQLYIVEIVELLLGSKWLEIADYFPVVSGYSLYAYVTNFEKIINMALLKNKVLAILTMLEVGLVVMFFAYAFYAGVDFISIYFYLLIALLIVALFVIFTIGSRFYSICLMIIITLIYVIGAGSESFNIVSKL